MVGNTGHFDLEHTVGRDISNSVVGFGTRRLYRVADLGEGGLDMLESRR